jgi:hypothetical protein
MYPNYLDIPRGYKKYRKASSDSSVYAQKHSSTKFNRRLMDSRSRELYTKRKKNGKRYTKRKKNGKHPYHS